MTNLSVNDALKFIPVKVNTRLGLNDARKSKWRTLKFISLNVNARPGLNDTLKCKWRT